MSGNNTGTIIGVAIVLVIILAIAFIAGPIYNVWASEQNGKAELAQGEYNRQLQVVESKAKLDSAANLADAEVRRAEGVAKANKIIGDSLRDNQAYLDYLWVTEIGTNTNKETVYVPTEAQLPILEATRGLRTTAKSS